MKALKVRNMSGVTDPYMYKKEKVSKAHTPKHVVQKGYNTRNDM